MKKKLLLMLLVLMLSAAAVAAGILLGREGAPDVWPSDGTAAVTATPRSKLQVDEHAGARITPTPAPARRDVAIPGWASLTLPAGETEARVSLGNPVQNEGWYDLTFELRLRETGEVLFASGLVPAGQYLNRVTLSRPLEAGQYDAVLRVQPYTADENQAPTNNADVELRLIVK